MKRTFILFFITLLSLNAILKSQNLQDSVTSKSFKKAEYLKTDLTKFLLKNTKYLKDAVENNIQGDVVLSFVILKDGKMDQLKVLSSPDKTLSDISMNSFNNLKNEWSPCINNGISIDKQYLIAYRYRIYFNELPPNDYEKAQRMINKQKYDKALYFIDAAIKENPFDYKLFDTRSKLKEMLGDAVGAKYDSEQSTKLQNDIITVVDVTVTGYSRTERRTEIQRMPVTTR